MTATRLEVSWTCRPCEVEGQDPQGTAPTTCWYCGGPVVVTARPTVPEHVFPETEAAA